MPDPEPPAWIEAFGRFLRYVFEPVGRFLSWVGSFLPDAPFARMILWTVIISAVIALVVIVVQRIRQGNWTWHKRTVAKRADLDNEWHPEASPVREWLNEADGLAGEGRFADAIHCLLLRSIDDLASRRPQLARPSLTGRELSQSPLLPARAQILFASIAGIVERSLFGRRPVEEAEWIEARRAYGEFALAEAWRR